MISNVAQHPPCVKSIFVAICGVFMPWSPKKQLKLTHCSCPVKPESLFHYHIRRLSEPLSERFYEIWKTQGRRLQFSKCSKIQQTSRRQCCYMPQFRAICAYRNPISQVRHLTKSCDKTSYRMLKRTPGHYQNGMQCYVYSWTHFALALNRQSIIDNALSTFKSGKEIAFANYYSTKQLIVIFRKTSNISRTLVGN